MSENNFDDLVPTRNRETEQRHRREVFWQISLPLYLGAIAVILVGGLAVSASSSSGSGSQWRDIALIWLILIALAASLLPLVALGALAYGTARLIDLLPRGMLKLQTLAGRIADVTESVSGKVSSPIIRINAAYSGLKRLLSGSGGRKMAG